MAKVVAKVLGGDPRNLDACSVADVKRQLNTPNHTAQLNGEAVEDSYRLRDDDYISLSPAVKGGR